MARNDRLSRHPSDTRDLHHALHSIVRLGNAIEFLFHDLQQCLSVIQLRQLLIELAAPQIVHRAFFQGLAVLVEFNPARVPGSFAATDGDATFVRPD